MRDEKPGERTLGTGFCFFGEATAAERVLESLRADTKPDEEDLRAWDYVQRIPGATLRSVPAAGHLVQEDAPEAIVAALLSELTAQT